MRMAIQIKGASNDKYQMEPAYRGSRGHPSACATLHQLTESYSLDGKRKICEGLDASTAEADAAMRADFEGLPDFAKKRLLDMLGMPEIPELDWQERILVDFDSLPDASPDFA